MTIFSLENIQENEEGFKAITDLCTTPIWIADEEGTVIWHNKNYGQVTGVDAKRIKPEDWEKLMEVDNLDEVRKTFRAHIKRKQSWKELYCQTSPQGEKRWYLVHADPVLDEKGNLVRWLGFNTDITSQKMIEEELRISEERYEMAALASKDVIWDWNLKTDQVKWSQSMSERLGHRLPHLTSNISWWDQMIHAEDSGRVTAGIREAINNRYSEWKDEYRFKRADGSYAIISDRGYIVCGADHVPVRMVGSMRDVTWERKAIETLKEAKRSAENSNAAKTAFLANVSHEVRTPLTAILGYVELLKAGDFGAVDNQAAAANEFLNVIERNGQQVLAILDDVLDLAKVENHNLKIKKEAFSLDQILEDIATLMRPKARAKGIKFVIHPDEETPKLIVSDPVRLRQILTNMASNAIKFTEKGRVDLKIFFEDAFLRILISDTGVGIPADQQANIFEPFHRGSPEISKKYGGSGLGLALTRKLCEAMGGSFELLRSGPGKGSVFEARTRVFPANHNEFKNSGEKQNRPPLADKKILVVDDASEIRMLVQRLLTRIGAQVDCAPNGTQALKMAVGREYDLILMDIQMPEMDGYQSLKALREAGVNTPVAALTAHAMKQDKDKALKSGFTSFVTKPMKIDEVVQVMGQLN